jgi:ribosomal RNA-processing protein 8
MFAVKGWNLGQVVPQTAPKKKLKRKRDDKDNQPHEQTGTATSIKGPRNNPFAIRQMQPPKPHIKSDSPQRHQKPAIGDWSGEASELRNVDPGSVKRAEKATRKAKKRHQRKLKSVASGVETPSVEIEKQTTSSARAVTDTASRFTPLQEKMRQKLSGSQFRHINEKLYTTHSSEALSLFTNEPSLFHNVLPYIKLI